MHAEKMKARSYLTPLLTWNRTLQPESDGKCLCTGARQSTSIGAAKSFEVLLNVDMRPG